VVFGFVVGVLVDFDDGVVVVGDWCGLVGDDF